MPRTKKEVFGEYILQFGKYKGKSFRWLLENDLGYTIYLMINLQQEEAAGVFMAEGHIETSLLSFDNYAQSFEEIQSLFSYVTKQPNAPSASSEGDHLVGFGARAKSTWQEIWNSRADGYASFIMGTTCVPGTRMYKLQKYLRSQMRSAHPPVPVSSAIPKPMEMESAMLDITPSKLQRQCPPSTPSSLSSSAAELGLSAGTGKERSAARPKPPPDTKELQLPPVNAPALPAKKTPVPIPKELMCLVPEQSGSTQAESLVSSAGNICTVDISPACRVLTFEECGKDEKPSSSETATHGVLHTAEVSHVSSSPQPAQKSGTSAIPRCPPPQPLDYDHDIRQWKCSNQQRIWMKTRSPEELESLGLWPGSRPVSNPMKMVSLWHLPPQPELIDAISDLPSPKYFQLHPFFIWTPENSTCMARLTNNYALPCIEGCKRTQVTSAGVGRPRAIVGITGQYYLFSSRLNCKVCKKRWYADNPRWLEKLPKRFTNVLPAVLTYKKAICKSLLDELRRTGKSPTDMANQVTEIMHLKYERANLAYLLACQNVLDSEAGMSGQKSITGFIRKETQPSPFGEYGDADGWNGLRVSAHHLTDLEKIVEGIMEKQQQQQQLEQKRKRTKTCLACGQPKSRYENDGSSVHFFYQQGPVRYFYCSRKVFQTYSGEGLMNPKMQLQDFMETEFFQRELAATSKRVEDKKQQKRKRPEAVGRLCTFCKMELKQGPNSPHLHTDFPGIAGKYIYCPAKVFSIYQHQGMEHEMTWKEFQKSAFYEMERQRWVAEKRKPK